MPTPTPAPDHLLGGHNKLNGTSVEWAWGKRVGPPYLKMKNGGSLTWKWKSSKVSKFQSFKLSKFQSFKVSKFIQCFVGRYWSHITKFPFHVSVRYWSHIQNFQEFAYHVSRYWSHIQAFQEFIKRLLKMFGYTSFPNLSKNVISKKMRVPIVFYKWFLIFLNYLEYLDVPKKIRQPLLARAPRLRE